MAIESWTNPKPLCTKLDSGTIPNGLEGFGIRPSFKDTFLSRRAKSQSHDSQLFHRRTPAAQQQPLARPTRGRRRRLPLGAERLVV
jgi:hypothetical protein